MCSIHNGETRCYCKNHVDIIDNSNGCDCDCCRIKATSDNPQSIKCLCSYRKITDEHDLDPSIEYVYHDTTKCGDDCIYCMRNKKLQEQQVQAIHEELTRGPVNKMIHYMDVFAMFYAHNRYCLWFVCIMFIWLLFILYSRK